MWHQCLNSLHEYNSNFGLTLAREKLIGRYDIQIELVTSRQWMNTSCPSDYRTVRS